MKIAVLAGDGIGPEITAQAVRVLAGAGRRRAAARDWSMRRWAAPATTAAGDPLPEPTLQLAARPTRSCSASVGGPKYDTLPRAKRPEQGLLRLRKHFDLFANLRPAIVYPGAGPCLDPASPRWWPDSTC